MRQHVTAIIILKIPTCKYGLVCGIKQMLTLKYMLNNATG